MLARRTFLASLAAASVTMPGAGRGAAGDAAYLATATLDDGTPVLVGLDIAGVERFRVPLPARAHAGAAHPTRAETVVFARPPGNFALVTDIAAEQVIAELAPPDGCQLNGHGVYADGGATLLTVEQTALGSEGLIGFWDVASGYTRIGEIPTHGRGPQDVRLMPDGRTLVVANAGTGAETGTAASSPEEAPSLSYVSLAGELLERTRLAAEQTSGAIRRLALRDDGLVGFALQWSGDPESGQPVLGLHRRGTRPVLAQPPRAEAQAMRGHAGAIAFSGDGTEIAVSSPRGGRLHRFSADGTFFGAEMLTGVVGLAPHPAGFVATEAYGGIVTLGADGVQMLAEHDLSWEEQILAV